MNASRFFIFINFATIQAEWDADDSDCQGKTQIKTFFLKLELSYYVFKVLKTGLQH